MMNKYYITLLLFTLIIPSADGAEVYLSADKTNLTLGESIKFTLEVVNDEKIGGFFLIEEQVGPKKYDWVKTFVQYSSCPGCGGQPLYGDLKTVYFFKPTHEGIYLAEANFDRVKAAIEFNVSIEKTTTTTSSSTSTSTSSTTSTTSSTTTSSSTTSSSTTQSSTTTMQSTTTTLEQSGGNEIFYISILIFIVAVLAIVLIKLLGSR